MQLPNVRKPNGGKLFQNGSKFADDFFSLSGKISALRKIGLKRPKTACFCPNGSKMVVNHCGRFSSLKSILTFSFFNSLM